MLIPAELMKRFDEVEQSMVPAELREKGWIYKDIPGRFTPEMWDLFINLLGEGNYQLLIMSQGPDWKRGQFFLSPKAIENLKAYADARNRQA